MDVRRELNRRIANSLEYPDVPRIKVILDEEESLKRNLSDEQFEAVQDVISLIQDEGRKYGVEITIAMHSLKKENTGIDSANLQQMDWLVFHKAAYDSTTRYPEDFDPKDIRRKAKRIARQLNPKFGRVCVVVKQQETEPLITVLPLLPIPTINLVDANQPQDTQEQSSEAIENAIQVITEWYFKVKNQLGSYPDDETLRESWLRLTGKLLNEKSLIYLRDRIHERWNPNVKPAN